MFAGLRIHWKCSTILKTSNKDVSSNVFWYVKVCIFWKCIQYTIHWDKTNVKKILLDKINGTKMASFFFREIQLLTVLLLISDSYMSWSTRLISLKLCVGFSIFDPLRCCWSSYFCSTKCMNSLTFRRHNSFQNHIKRKPTHSFATKFLNRNKKF